jgi:predicted nucleic acid-binding Zn ribbon protein
VNRRAPRPLSVALATVTARLAPATALARVQSVWATVVGETIAAHCTPVSERGGVFQIACDESVWAAELELMAPELIDRLARQLGASTPTMLRCRTDAQERTGLG